MIVSAVREGVDVGKNPSSSGADRSLDILLDICCFVVVADTSLVRGRWV